MRYFILAIILTIHLAGTAEAQTLSNEKFAQIFSGYNACFLMESISDGKRLVYNEAKKDKRMAPCSTFKIFNSLTALDTKVVDNEFSGKRYDGTVYSIKSWMRDQTLQSAITNSCLWYFQKVAEDIGVERMSSYLKRVGYGNQVISGGIKNFWINDSLQISPEEQLNFIKGLVKEELPFKKRSMAIVRGMLRDKETPHGVMYGKTGSNWKDGKKFLGWYVGYLSTPQDVFIFATNIEAEDNAWGPVAKKLTRKVFSEMGLL